MSTTKQDYRNFKHNTLAPWCWACGRDESQRPDRWFSEWWVDRAHIVNKIRVEHPKAVILLCRMCHERSRMARFPQCEGHDWPKLTLENFLWLKRRFDPENYDRWFLKGFIVGVYLPRAAQLPMVYQRAYQKRRGGVLVG